MAEMLQPERLIVSDCNAASVAALKEYFHSHPGVLVHRMDSYQCAATVVELDPQLVFLDPPYVDAQEWFRLEGLLAEIVDSCPTSRLLIWYPIRDGLQVRKDGLPGENVTALDIEFAGNRGSLRGCGMLFINFSAAQLASLPELVTGLKNATVLELGEISLCTL